MVRMEWSQLLLRSWCQLVLGREVKQLRVKEKPEAIRQEGREVKIAASALQP